MRRAVFCKERIRIAAHADDGDLHVQHHGNESQQLVCLTRIADGKNDVVLGHNAKVAVIDVKRIDKEGRRARAGKRGCYLGSDVSALSHARNDYLSVAVEHQFHCFLEVLVQSWYEIEHCFCLVFYAMGGIFVHML